MISGVMIINGCPTSVCMEQAYCEALDQIANRGGLLPLDLVSELDRDRGDAPFKSALRLKALTYFRERFHLLNQSGEAPAEKLPLARTSSIGMGFSQVVGREHTTIQ